jgi:hypothetical protein
MDLEEKHNPQVIDCSGLVSCEQQFEDVRAQT